MWFKYIKRKIPFYYNRKSGLNWLTGKCGIKIIKYWEWVPNSWQNNGTKINTVWQTEHVHVVKECIEAQIIMISQNPCVSVKLTKDCNTSLQSYLHQHVWLLYTSLALSIANIIYKSSKHSSDIDADYTKACVQLHNQCIELANKCLMQVSLPDQFGKVWQIISKIYLIDYLSLLLGLVMCSVHQFLNNWITDSRIYSCEFEKLNKVYIPKQHLSFYHVSFSY